MHPTSQRRRRRRRRASWKSAWNCSSPVDAGRDVVMVIGPLTLAVIHKTTMASTMAAVNASLWPPRFGVDPRHLECSAGAATWRWAQRVSLRAPGELTPSARDRPATTSTAPASLRRSARLQPTLWCGARRSAGSCPGDPPGHMSRPRPGMPPTIRGAAAPDQPGRRRCGPVRPPLLPARVRRPGASSRRHRGGWLLPLSW
jgi:hypothetical protein